MRFTSIILATGLAVSANAAVLPALFGAKVNAVASDSFKPTGTIGEGPMGTGAPHPMGSGGFGGGGFATGSGAAPCPITTGASGRKQPSKRQFGLANSESTMTAKFSGFAMPMGTFPTDFPSMSGGFALPSGGSNFNVGQNFAQKSGSFGGGGAQPTGSAGGQGGSAKPSGLGGNDSSMPSGAGGFGGASPTGAFGSGFGGGSAQPTGSSYSLHSRNTIPEARRGWFF